jgi:hypothetical protein
VRQIADCPALDRAHLQPVKKLGETGQRYRQQDENDRDAPLKCEGSQSTDGNGQTRDSTHHRCDREEYTLSDEGTASPASKRSALWDVR